MEIRDRLCNSRSGCRSTINFPTHMLKGQIATHAHYQREWFQLQRIRAWYTMYYAVIISQVVVFEKTWHCGSYEAITLRSVSPIKYSPTLLVVYHR